jgi:hypothetical protein
MSTLKTPRSIQNSSKTIFASPTRPLIVSLIVALAALTGVGQIHAQSSSTAYPSTSRNNDFGWYGKGYSYIGLNAGLTNYKLNDGTGIFGSDKNATAYALYAGGYFDNSNFGAELGYIAFGSISRAGGSTKANGINLSFIGKIPLGESFNLLGKLGTIYSRTDVSAVAGSGVTAGNESGFDWSYGVGGEYLLGRQWSAVLQYDEHFMKYAGGVNERVTLTSLGMRYRY